MAGLYHQLPTLALALALTLTACGGGSSSSTSPSNPATTSSTGGDTSAPTQPVTVTNTASNVLVITLDSGPVSLAGTTAVINVPYASVTLCQPGTTVCQTIDHVLVDTGSYGLRILAPTIAGSSLSLPSVTAPSGNPAGECAQFFSGYLWGSVRLADVKLGSELASSIPVQLAADTSGVFANVPSSCANTGASLGSVKALGANGILGIGLFKQDCGTTCASKAIAGTYYSCTTAGCTSSAMPLANQVLNPVAAFSTNNNGVVLTVPSVGTTGAATVSGTLTFGVDTQSNNNVGAATVYAASASGYFTTTYRGSVQSTSFIDSGSNALFFSDSSLPACTSSSGFSGFYCPTGSYTVTATNSAASGSAAGPISVTIVAPNTLASGTAAAPVGAPLSTSRRSGSATFDWGMPFFFGRSVYVVMDGATTAHGTGPYWAY